MAHPFLQHIHGDELNLLDWEAIANQLNSFAYFEKTQIQLSRPPVSQTREEILSEQEQLQQCLLMGEHRHALTSLFSKYSLPQKDHIYHEFTLLPKGKVLHLEQVNLSARLIEWANDFVDRSSEFYEKKPRFLPNVSSGLKLYQKNVRQLVDISSSINYENHPELKELFRELKAVEEKVREKIQELKNDSDLTHRLQHEQHDIIHDRYVLAIRSDSYKGDLGLIVSKSSTGMTLYVEPFSIRELANRRLHLLAKIEAVIEKICHRFSSELSDIFDDFNSLLKSLEVVDSLLARSEIINRYELAPPSISESPQIILEQCFHPIIDNPVKNDIKIFENSNGLMISGPNTGGKTVLLKSIAICYIFLYKGLYVPASHASLFPFEKLFFLSHDHQDISKGLSSFASEAEGYIKILNAIDNKAPSTHLIIIDEIFNSTSSDEASSLALALLEFVLNNEKVKLLLSTHHQLLKSLNHHRGMLESAHMEFDMESKRPTYKINVGEPGSSLAFEIFESLASPDPNLMQLIDRAKEYHHPDNLSYEELLRELSAKKVELQKIINENDKVKKELVKKQRAAEGLAHLEKEKIIEKYEAQFEKTLQEINSIKDQAQRSESYKQVSKYADQVKSVTNKALDKKQAPVIRESKRTFDEFSINDDVIHLMSGKKCRVLSLDARKNKIQIGQGPMRFWVHPHEIETAKSQPNPKQSHFTPPLNEEEAIEFDARGLRLEDFKDIIDKKLDNLLAGSLPYLVVIHGHGTGALKSWLRRNLDERNEFVWVSPEGNDGCTEVRVSYEKKN